MKNKEKDITFHYTNEVMAKDLINLIQFKNNSSVLDAGSGKNKVFYNNIPSYCEKYECEIEDGNDFLKWDKKVDWVIGNPPFHLGWKFTEKAFTVANFGVAFLVNINVFNQFTPRRLELIAKSGFFINKIHIVADKRWFGRYYFIIFTKNENNFFSWKLNQYSN